MGFLRRNKKDKYKSKEKIDDKLPPEIINKRNFRFLDFLVSSNVEQITLDSDIIIDDGEEAIYPTGIDVNVDTLVIDGNGHSIDAGGRTSIFNVHEGKMIFVNTTFKNSNIKDGALLITSQKSVIIFKDCYFKDNHSRIVYNDGILVFENTCFLNNSSPKNELILNNREIKLVNTVFKANESCIILNKGKMECLTIGVNDNRGNGKSLIVNEEHLEFNESIFANNEEMSEICYNKGDLTFKECSFNSNTGRLLDNRHIIRIKDMMFKDNFSPQRELILNNNRIELFDVESINNNACFILNNGKMRCNAIDFYNNKFEGEALIVNEGIFDFANSKIMENECDNVIYLNRGNSSFSYLIFRGNLSKHLVYNENDKSIKIYKTTFENEPIDEGYDIFNEGYLTLDDSKFLIEHGKYVLNDGTVQFKRMDYSYAEGIGTVTMPIEAYKPKSKIEEKLPNDLWGKRNFRFLDNVIMLAEKEIILDNDIILEDGEEADYHKGIDVIVDELTIDGQGLSIDACNRTSIFNVREGSVIFRNIRFKNAFSIDGALLTVSEKSQIIVENCSFEDNQGRIIFNEGRLVLKNDKFKDNISPKDELVFNSNDIIISSNNFYNNDSRIIINNVGNAQFEISESYFDDNRLEIAPIINIGNGRIESCDFNGNVNHDNVHIDIYNRSMLHIESTMFSGTAKTIFNDGDISMHDSIGEICELSGNLTGPKPLHDFIDSIEDDGNPIIELNAFDFDPNYVDNLKSFERSPDANGFAYLDNLIQGSPQINLTSDIHLENGEDSIYEYGIKLDADGLVIDGENHIINAEFIRCIFDVTARNVTLKNVHFKFSLLKERSSIIRIGEQASLTLINCHFEHNRLDNGHSIFNNGNVHIEDCVFLDNRSKNEASAIYSRHGKIKIASTVFKNNKSGNSGGAILNWGNMEISLSEFTDNISKGYGGAIGNVTDAILKIKETDFINNKSIGEGSGIYNENNLNIYDSNFSNHSGGYNIIFNETKTDIFNCNFMNNNLESIVKNDENAILNVSNSKFISNKIEKSAICNIGKSCGLEKITFKENESEMEYCSDIYNLTYMRLKDIRIDKSSKESILNTGSMEVWKISDEIINDSIHNLGEVIVMDEECNNPFNFSALDKLIQESDEDTIHLENNYVLENCESYFYEGGLDLNRNDLTIDGNGHIIDAKGKTRIFIVTGENVTLKNIKFKNGKLFNVLEEHITGGGVIKTVENSSLNIINCEFIGCDSEDDGGAILNNGLIKSIDSRFENNKSNYYGGAINNRNTLYLKNNLFKGNRSQVAGAIFNFKTLHVDDIHLNENFSNFPQSIFNNGSLEIRADDMTDELIFNVGDINRHESDDHESFSFLAGQIRENNVIQLKQNIIFDFRKDKDFADGIEIDTNESLVIDGRGFAIDGNNRSGFFNFKNSSSNIVFKNIIFRNSRSHEFSALENNASLHFINCRFIDNHTNLLNNNGSVKINHSQFINNYSKESIISNNNSLEIAGCRFIINNVSSKNGVIGNGNELSVRDSKFLHNSSHNGGAINNRKNGILTILNSLFDNNSSKGRGGALINFSKIIIGNCEFKSNFSKGLGGAIYNEENSQIEIHKLVFKDNFSASSGGALANWGDLKLSDTTFEGNSTNKDGGAIYVEEGRLIIDGCSFLNNEAKDGAGIFNWGDIEMNNCTFRENRANKCGGALNIYGGEFKSRYTLFSNNASKLDGGAIYSQNGNLNILNSRFDSNSADGNGGALINWTKVNIVDGEFINNASKKNGGAVNNQKSGRINISHSKIIENIAEDGGGIYTIVDNAVKLENCNLINNYPNDFK